MENLMKKLKSLLANKAVRFLLITVFWFLLWTVLYLIIHNTLLFPSPWSVLVRLSELVRTGAFWKSTAISLLRVISGILSAVLLGVLFAFLSFKSKVFHSVSASLVLIVKSTPVASFIILLLLWLNRDLVPVVISFLLAFPAVVTNVEEGLCQRESKYLKLAKIYRLGHWKVFRHITVPSVLPYFISSLRTSIGLAWKAGISAEILSLPLYSIGRSIYESKMYLETKDLLAWTLVVILFSLAIEYLLVFLFQKLSKKSYHQPEREEKAA